MGPCLVVRICCMYPFYSLRLSAFPNWPFGLQTSLSRQHHNSHHCALRDIPAGHIYCVLTWSCACEHCWWSHIACGCKHVFKGRREHAGGSMRLRGQAWALLLHGASHSRQLGSGGGCKYPCVISSWSNLRCFFSFVMKGANLAIT